MPPDTYVNARPLQSGDTELGLIVNDGVVQPDGKVVLFLIFNTPDDGRMGTALVRYDYPSYENFDTSFHGDGVVYLGPDTDSLGYTGNNRLHTTAGGELIAIANSALYRVSQDGSTAPTRVEIQASQIPQLAAYTFSTPQPLRYGDTQMTPGGKLLLSVPRAWYTHDLGSVEMGPYFLRLNADLSIDTTYGNSGFAEVTGVEPHDFLPSFKVASDESIYLAVRGADFWSSTPRIYTYVHLSDRAEIDGSFGTGGTLKIAASHGIFELDGSNNLYIPVQESTAASSTGVSDRMRKYNPSGVFQGYVDTGGGNTPNSSTFNGTSPSLGWMSSEILATVNGGGWYGYQAFDVSPASGNVMIYGSYCFNASRLNNVLEPLGWTFDRSSTDLSPSNLANFDMLIIVQPCYWSPTAAEITAVTNWVNNGGRLWMMLDYNPDEVAKPNMFAANFDVTFNYNSIGTFYISDWIAHTISSGITPGTTHFAAGCSLNVNSPAEVVARGPSGHNLIGAREYGAGRALFYCDSTLVYPYGGNNGRNDLIKRMAYWLINQPVP